MDEDLVKEMEDQANSKQEKPFYECSEADILENRPMLNDHWDDYSENLGFVVFSDAMKIFKDNMARRDLPMEWTLMVEFRK